MPFYFPITMDESPTCKKKPIISNSPSFEVGEDDSMGTMGEDIIPSWAFARLGGSIALEK